MFKNAGLVAIAVLIAAPLLVPVLAQGPKSSNSTQKKKSGTKEKSGTTEKKADFPTKKGQNEEDSPSSAGMLEFDSIFGATRTQLSLIEENVSDAKKFSPKVNTRNARVLAVLAQILSEYTEDSPRQKMSPTVRDGALKIAKAKTAGEAKKELEALKKAFMSPPMPKADVSWETLIDIPTAMEEIKIQQEKYGKYISTGKPDGDVHAQLVVLWSLGVALQKIQPKLKDEAERKAWDEYSKRFTNDFAFIHSASLRSSNPEALKQVWNSTDSCTACHDRFRKKK